MLALLENLPKETLSLQLGYGAVLMVLGMFTVFVFLIVLIYCTKLMSVICRAILKGKKGSKTETKIPGKGDENKSSKALPVDEDVAIAIAIALSYERSNE